MKILYEKIFDFKIINLYFLYFIIIYNLYFSQKISINNGSFKGSFSETNLRKYLDKLQFFLRTFVVCFLIIRFNPFTKNDFTNFDRKLVFSSALLLLSTTGINEVIISNKYISQQIKNLYSLVI